jgi:cell fate (sporulation/competence/biofilm development) regulator YmcA (YheA/YmcA/DUF963 family)
VKRLSTKDKAQLINDYLLSKEEVIAYKHYESLLKDHPEIKEMEDELKAMQKELTRRKVRDEEISDLYEKYLTKKKAFEEHPLIVNYLNLKEEVNALLLNVEDLINNELS